MRTSRSVLLAAALCVLALPACGDTRGDQAEPATPSATTAGDDVASIAVEQVGGSGAGTVWSLDRGLQGDLPGADAAFRVAGRPEVRRDARRFRSNAMMETPEYRVIIEWTDGERRELTGGEGQLGSLYDVVRATQKAAEPVRG